MLKKHPLFISMVLVILLAMVSLIIPPEKVVASNIQTIYLHKQVNVDGSTDGLLKETRDINGVEFIVIDVTNFVKQNSSSNEAIVKTLKAVSKEAVQGLAVGDAVPLYKGMTVAAKGVTARALVLEETGVQQEVDGVLTLYLNSKVGESNACYLMIETMSAEDVTASDNIVLQLPVKDQVTEAIKDNIHVYSKGDHLIIPLEPGIVKTLDEKKQDFDYSQAISYNITVSIPTLIEEYQKFQVVDVPDPLLEVDIASIKILDKQKQPLSEEYYTVAQSDNGFVIDFIPQYLSTLAESNLVITYQLRIKPNSVPDTNFVNKAFLFYNDSYQDFQLETASKEVRTGGYSFVKVDGEDKKNKLKDAVFVIRNKQKEYLTQEYTWKTSQRPEEDNELLRLTSNQQGNFEIKGLAYGEYKLEEIIAPEGYELLPESVGFTISQNSYLGGQEEAIRLEVINRKKIVTGKTGPLNSLPKTGETINHKGVVVGNIIIFIGLLYFYREYTILKKRRTNNEIE